MTDDDKQALSRAVQASYWCTDFHDRWVKFLSEKAAILWPYWCKPTTFARPDQLAVFLRSICATAVQESSQFDYQFLITSVVLRFADV